jgi:hypothetical protein
MAMVMVRAMIMMTVVEVTKWKMMALGRLSIQGSLVASSRAVD